MIIQNQVISYNNNSVHCLYKRFYILILLRSRKERWRLNVVMFRRCTKTQVQDNNINRNNTFRYEDKEDKNESEGQDVVKLFGCKRLLSSGGSN